MNSELIIRRTENGHYDVIEPSDPAFTLSEINDAQLLGYLKNRKIVGMTAEEVLEQFDINENRSEVHVTIDRNL